MGADMKPGDPADRAADGAFGGVTSHRAGYGDRLARVEDWLRRHPDATLQSGEGAVLLEEIDQLRRQILIFVDMAATWVKVGHENERLQDAIDRLRVENRELRDIRLNMGRGINMLRAAIERVRALHRPTLEGAHCVVCHSSDSSDWDFYPCPTLRALDGDA